MKGSPSLLYCSFCRKDSKTVRKLISGPGVYICDECVEACNQLLAGRTIRDFPGWDALDDRELLRALRPAEAAREAVDASLRGHVDTLRARGVTWERIGRALRISRQAAWQRFAGGR